MESESQIPSAAPIFRGATGSLSHRRHLAGRARQGVFDAGKFGERSAAGAHVVSGGSPPWMASADSDVDLYRKENWKAVQEWLQKDLIDPLTKEAEETSDPLVRNQLVLAAGLNSLLHTQLLSLVTTAAAPGGSHGPAGPRGLPEEELKQLLCLIGSASRYDKGHSIMEDKEHIQAWRWRR